MSTIEITTGTEGPHHDPYGWEELTVTRNDGTTVILHQGLAEYVEINGLRIEPRISAVVDPRDRWNILRDHFQRAAGVTPEAARRAYERMRSRCSKCGGTETRSMQGYPGETFEVCVECGTVVDSHFNESAII